MFKAITIFLFLLLQFTTPAIAQLQGYVFEDNNKNGRKDSTEKGIAKVAVSNQITTINTDAEGFYLFDTLEHLGSLSISLPIGYKGASWRRVGELPAQTLDFPLQTAAVKNKFTFIHASDTHIQPNNRYRMQRFREMADSIAPDFVVVTGDLVKDALRVPEEEASSYYELYVEELSKFSMPVWSVPGNHEIFGIERHESLVSEQHPLYGKKMFRHFLGPNYYSFNYGGMHFIGLDAVNYHDLWYYGDIDPVQLDWLQTDLRQLPKDMPVVTFNHIALVSPGFGLDGFREEGVAPTLISVNGTKRFRHLVGNAAEVISILRTHPYPLALAGHFHSAQSATFETQGNKTLFAQTSAITGPRSYYFAGMKVTSGFTLYEIENGKMVGQKFIPLDK